MNQAVEEKFKVRKVLTKRRQRSHPLREIKPFELTKEILTQKRL